MEFDLGELSRAVGQEVTAYTIDAIDPGRRVHSVTGGVYRVRGDGFSLVIKIVCNGSDADPDGLWVSGTEPAHRNYWKREWLAYGTGLLDALPGELRAPRTLLTTEVSEDECWIWLEDVKGLGGAQWQLDDYDSVAFDLATTQAAYPSGRSVLPDQPWLSRQWLRGWVDTVGHRIAQLDAEAAWSHESLAPLADLRDRIGRLWKAREELLAIVESAPQTVVHCDFWPTNLIAADDGTTVAIDWSQVGIGALGQDLDQLTLDPVWMQVLPDASLEDLDRHVLPGYLSGLRSSGFDVSEADLRRWYSAAAGVRYAPLAALSGEAARDPDALQVRFNRPAVAVISDRRRVIERALELGEAALNSA
jgi:Phosphotransferase enzyme family